MKGLRGRGGRACLSYKRKWEESARSECQEQETARAKALGWEEWQAEAGWELGGRVVGICSVVKPFQLWRTEDWKAGDPTVAWRTRGAVWWAEMELGKLVIVSIICMLTICQYLSPPISWRAKIPKDSSHNRGLPFLRCLA